MHFTTRLYTLAFMLMGIHNATASSVPPGSPINEIESRSLSIQKTSSPIQLDGELTEDAWQQAGLAANFYRKFPDDRHFATAQTIARVTYDDRYIYIAAECFNAPGQRTGNYMTSTLKRDFDAGRNDFFAVYLDPFNDKNNGFSFAVSPLGVQREGLVANGGNTGSSTDWDNKWFVHTKIYEDKWVAEIAIPLKSIRFKPGITEWGINFARRDVKHNEESAWSHIPINFRLSTLGFSGVLLWDTPLEKTGANVSLIPFISANGSKDYTRDTLLKSRTSAGMDAKVAVTSSLNLDLTVNPDFSQVEVDRQVTNLSRFELFFPERRQFFIENSDLFSSAGFSRIRPFFSRRIGIAQDPATGQNVENRILYGARLSGKLDKDWRIGLMNMQTARNEQINLQSQNYTVAALQRQVFSRSNISGIFINKQEFFADSTGEFNLLSRRFNRVAGLDYNLLSKDNKWSGKFFYHRSFLPEHKGDQAANAAFLSYNTRNFNIAWNHEYVGKNYTAETGFVQRRGHYRIEPNARYTFFPKSERIKSTIANYGTGVDTDFFLDHSYRLTDRSLSSFVFMNFLNTSSISFILKNEYIMLQRPFDPTGTGGLAFEKGTDYTFTRIGGNFTSDNRKKLSMQGGASTGTYYNGNLSEVHGTVSYLAQPIGLLSLNVNYTDIDLPEPYNDAQLLLISPRMDLSLSKSLFFTSIAQYNNQVNNVNLNARLQWRFKPVSDLFLVYSDNYMAESMKVKNRSLVLKVTYWLNA